MIKKIILGSLFLGLLISIAVFYSVSVQGALTEKTTIYISSEDSYSEVFEKLKPRMKSPQLFDKIAALKKYPSLIKDGKYIIGTDQSIISIVNDLRIGKQVPVNIKFNNQDNLEQLAIRLSEQLELNSGDLYRVLSDSSFIAKNGFTINTALAMYLPNTYQVYWDIEPEQLRARFLNEYRKFWNDNRVAKAKAQGLSPIEASILASIVQKETSYLAERPTVAGLYLNRIHQGIPLQADPTVIYALKQAYGQDFEVKRVLNKDLLINSPYNTYKHRGLPPGLISMPDLSSINAVLNPAQHDYIYMCASVDNPGQHEFARSLSKHNANAAKYRRWINQQGIKR
ncbi:MAG: endolytic transglycosylase MltG [Flavobacteriaceae bacterium]